MSRGTFGEIRVWEDFTHFEDNIAATGVASSIVFGTGYVSVGDVGLVSVNEGSLAWTIDEPGGILAITTDTGDDDNACLVAGPFRPTDGGMECEYRFKIDNLTTESAIYAGTSETMALDTPVMPAEFATVTMTYNGSGGMMGANFDIDGTTDDFRAIAGDGGAGAGGSSTTGVRANEVLTTDEWYLVRVEVGNDGNGTVYVGHKGDQMDRIAATGAVQGKSWTGAPINPNDRQYAVCMVENRTGAANVFEVDYFFARGFRDWANT